MRISRNAFSTLVIVGLLVTGIIVTLRVSNDARITQFVNERNKFCSNLSIELSGQEGIENCFCYYEGFKTGEQQIDSKTLPLCACECMINGTTQKIGLLEARA